MVPLIGRQLIGRTHTHTRVVFVCDLITSTTFSRRDGRVARDKICLPESLGRQPTAQFPHSSFVTSWLNRRALRKVSDFAERITTSVLANLDTGLRQLLTTKATLAKRENRIHTTQHLRSMRNDD